MMYLFLILELKKPRYESPIEEEVSSNPGEYTLYTAKKFSLYWGEGGGGVSRGARV